MSIPRVLLIGALLTACGAETPLPVLASSRYVDYSTWAEPTVICMDDKLAEWDHLIEETADFLQVARPTGRIRYVWGPEIAGFEDDWGCDDGAVGCYHHDDQGGTIYTRLMDTPHEFVHAVELSALGGAIALFKEGLADYLGSQKSTEGVLDDYPRRFQEVLAEWQADDYQYRVAMHFVGSVILRDGVGRYKELRKRVPLTVDLAEFTAIYSGVFGRDLDADLESMAAMPIQGRQAILPGCDTGLPSVPWTSPDLIDTTLHGECGDGRFYGGGFADGYAAFATYFVVQIEKEGGYELTIRDPSPSGELPPRATLDPCPGVMSHGGVSSQGQTSYGLLAPGTHILRVFYPPMPEARKDLSFTLQWSSPLPP